MAALRYTAWQPQGIRWLDAWLRVRPDHDLSEQNPHLFPGFSRQAPITETTFRIHWADLHVKLGMPGLWTYYLRRTLACYLGNELHYDDATIRAVLNHYDGTALSHYYLRTSIHSSSPSSSMPLALQLEDHAGRRGVHAAS
jgi:integrase